MNSHVILSLLPATTCLQTGPSVSWFLSELLKVRAGAHSSELCLHGLSLAYGNSLNVEEVMECIASVHLGSK